MKGDAHLLDIRELRTWFENLKSVRRTDLRHFYLQRHPDLTEQAFRRILYALEKQKIVISIGAGVYVFGEPFPSTGKSIFTPALSIEIDSIYILFKDATKMVLIYGQDLV